MAEALWTKPQNRARARALAQEANELYKRSGSEVDAERRAVERWLSKH